MSSHLTEVGSMTERMMQYKMIGLLGLSFIGSIIHSYNVYFEFDEYVFPEFVSPILVPLYLISITIIAVYSISKLRSPHTDSSGLRTIKIPDKRAIYGLFLYCVMALLVLLHYTFQQVTSLTAKQNFFILFETLPALGLIFFLYKYQTSVKFGNRAATLG